MLTNKPLILAGDIGGTKTNLAVFAAGNSCPLAETTFPSMDYADLESMISAFLADKGLPVKRAAFGVAGPVIEGRAKITKLPWLIEAAAIKRAFALEEVVLVNDLVATGHGLACLPPGDLLCLQQGEAVIHGPLSVIAPGTGLGEAMLFWHEQEGYQPQATEGGQALFSPATQQQLALANFLFPSHGAVTYDLLSSGRGLPLIFAFLQAEGRYGPPPSWLVEALGSADPASLISQAALDALSPNPLCLASLRLFVEILAVESANLAFKALSTGGLYLAGGIPPRMVAVFAEVFVPAFIGQRPLGELLAAMPVHLVTNPKTALLGAARLLGDDA